jgi:hypothetical protein
MKAYLTISGAIFGLLALWHVFELITHWRTLESDKWFTVSMCIVIVLSGTMCLWAWVLLKLNRCAAEKSSAAGNTLH